MSSKNALNKPRVRRDPFRKWSIARRLTLLYAASSFLMLVLATTYLYWSLVENLEREDNAFLANEIQECRRLLHERPTDEQLLAHEIQIEAATNQFIKYYVRLLDNQGRILLETPRMADVLPVASFPAAIATTEIPTRGTVWKSAAGESHLLMSARVHVNREGIASQILHVALDVSTEEALIAGYRRKLLAVVALGIVFSCAVGIFVARQGLQPLKDITRATDRITASQLHERIVANAWPEELASLARSFDQMLDRLEDSFSRLSQFSADLAHELRTPINNLRGEAGVALSQARRPEEYRRTLESSLEEYARLSRLIDNLLFLARADGPMISIARTPCDARKAIEVVREFYEALAEDRGIEVVCGGEATLEADPVLFRQTISNLLSNALSYTPRGGKVSISVQRQDDRTVEVSVNDTGCGIPAEHLPKIFDRFYRVDPARSQQPSGSGLGLAIVKSIMDLHGGTVSMQSEVGKGSTFTLKLPLAGVSAAHR
jgi:two-component system, OmpR family, heavy metal sensor histidine kinase CusS